MYVISTVIIKTLIYINFSDLTNILVFIYTIYEFKSNSNRTIKILKLLRVYKFTIHN